jgi:DNA-binding beta-propeller fold protein YncE
MKILLLIAGLFGISLTIHAAETGNHWAVTGRIPIGGAGGWDYVTVEPKTHRLFLSHATQVVVVDLKTNRIAGSIPAAGVHGIALAPELKRGFISNGGEGTVTIFDLDTLKVLGKVPAGLNPDAICYEPVTRRVFAFNGRSHTATVIDAAKGAVVGEIPLGGKPEFARADGAGLVFVNLEDKSKVLKIDAAKLAILEQWTVPAEAEPSAMAIDAAGHRLFVGCGNKQLVVMDSGSGNVIATLPIGGGVDAAVYDPVGKRVFASCGDGTMTVIDQASANAYSVEETVPTEKGARTMGFDPTTNTAYLPIAKFGPAPLPSPQNPKPRPSIISGSLELLVVTRRP